MIGGWGFPSQYSIPKHNVDHDLRGGMNHYDHRSSGISRCDIGIIVCGSIASLLLVFFLFGWLIYQDKIFHDKHAINRNQVISQFFDINICNDGESYGLPYHSRFFRQRDERRAFCKEILKK